MRALMKSPLILALSIVVVGATIGFAGCGSSKTSNNDGGTGGASSGGGGSNGSGGAGGSTGSGGHADAGSDVHTGAGGSGTDSGSSCTALLACCGMATGPLKTACMAQYNTAMSQGDGACANVLEMIRGYGVCN